MLNEVHFQTAHSGFFLIVFLLLLLDLFTDVRIFGFGNNVNPLIVLVSWAVIGNLALLLFGSNPDDE